MSAGNGAARFYEDGEPVWAEHASANVTNALAQPTAEMRKLIMSAALVQATLAQREAMQDLALAMRENARATQAMADEMRARRGA